VHLLRWDAELPGEEIQVKVERGVVTLLGAVPLRFQKAAAEERVQRLPGVIAVENRIAVRPAARRADIGGAVEQAFLRNAKLHGAGIAVSADGAKVTLSGTVRSVEDREVAAGVAWRTAGVGDVDNRLVVQP
jgi:osmotically-inducible protein OsmY